MPFFVRVCVTARHNIISSGYVKIIGVTYGGKVHGTRAVMLKGDSALLVNRKPFFIPDEVEHMVSYPALALRVSRLGKQVAPRFATRYFDAVAPALDLQAIDLRDTAIRLAQPWTEAVSMDGSFPVGGWTEVADTARQTWCGKWEHRIEGSKNATIFEGECSVETITEAVSIVSKNMTIRQGDIIYLQLTETPVDLHPNDTITAILNEDEQNALFCRIK